MEKRAGTEINNSLAKGHLWVRTDGTTLKLHTTPNMLGWLELLLVTDPEQIQRMLDARRPPATPDYSESDNEQEPSANGALPQTSPQPANVAVRGATAVIRGETRGRAADETCEMN